MYPDAIRAQFALCRCEDAERSLKGALSETRGMDAIQASLEIALDTVLDAKDQAREAKESE